MKIQMLKDYAGLSFKAGEQHDVPRIIADVLIKRGCARLVVAEKKKADKKEKNED